MIIREVLNRRLPQALLQYSCSRQLTRSSLAPRKEKKHYRLWALPGDHVLMKEVLVKQYTMKWHPGLNVGIDDERVLYALCDGIMVITEEKFDPDWSHPLVSKVYMEDEIERAPPHARYINVIPKKKVSEFKLVDMV